MKREIQLHGKIISIIAAYKTTIFYVLSSIFYPKLV